MTVGPAADDGETGVVMSDHRQGTPGPPAASGAPAGRPHDRGDTRRGGDPEPRSHQAHSHGGHDHDHASGLVGNRRRLVAVLTISLTILVAEIVGSALSGSLALLADAGHVLTDVAGLVLAVIAATLAQRPATDQRTWGYRRAEVLAAAAQAGILLAVGVFILASSVRHLVRPPEIGHGSMLAFGLVGLAGNAVGLAMLAGRRGSDLNMRAAFLEVLNDALGSVAVIIAAVVITATGWERADAIASLTIGALILPRTWRLLREALDILLESTPRGIDLAVVRAHLLEVPHVVDVHDLHASTVASNLPVLTAHVVVDDSCFSDGHVPVLLDQVQACLVGHFDVSHSTFQFEPVGHAEHERPAHA